jgi:Family of unknown function (DUF5678)
MELSPYAQNRAKVPLEELRKYAGEWVAFSKDGSRVVGSAPTLLALEERLTAKGEDLQGVALERIELEDCVLGGADQL